MVINADFQGVGGSLCTDFFNNHGKVLCNGIAYIYKGMGNGLVYIDHAEIDGQTA